MEVVVIVVFRNVSLLNFETLGLRVFVEYFAKDWNASLILDSGLLKILLNLLLSSASGRLT